ncbi:hypothetical protein Tco_1105647 [Tanacetum coccineum]
MFGEITVAGTRDGAVDGDGHANMNHLWASAQSISQKVKVNVVLADRESNKLIFSRKPKEKDDAVARKKNIMAKLSVGDVVNCCIKKINYYGIFVETQYEGFPNSLDIAKLHTSSEATQPRTELYLDEVTDGASGTIIVMICRILDVHTITGRYLSMDFVMSDAKANKEQHRIFRDHAYMIELDGATYVRKMSVKGGGFFRYPFRLKELGSIELTDNKYLIDVAGYVTNVDRITQKKSGSRTLDFSLANGSEDEVSLSQLLYMPTTLKLRKARWKTCSSGLETEKMILQPSNVESRLMALGHERDGTSHLVEENVRKGVMRNEGLFLVSGVVDRVVEYPLLRFRLELDVSDKTAPIMVMFDEPATDLVKCSADSLTTTDDDVGLAYANDVGLPRALANIIGTTQTLEIKTHTYYEHSTFERVSRAGGLLQKRVDLEDSDDEVTCGMDDGQADGNDSSVSDKRKKKRYIMDDYVTE